MKFSKLIRNLTDGLFASSQSSSHKTSSNIFVDGKPDDNIKISVTTSQKILRQPYFIQIGFDFGTSYSKGICRDMATNKSWVHIPPRSNDQELPFLMSSVIKHKKGILSCVDNSSCHYPENGLYHLKQAMVKTALKKWDDPVLMPYKEAIGTKEPEKIIDFLECSAVFYLAKYLGEIRTQIKKRMKGFGDLPADYMAVNLAVPVADAEQPEVNKYFNQVLSEAWCLAEELADFDTVSISDLKLLREKHSENEERFASEACFIYPEVSANVQGFVRSRVSSPGMYLFSDTGASTVDQSVFIFAREDHTEHLVYLIGRVLPLGSGNIERRAAEYCGVVNNKSLEDLRLKKERFEDINELRKAREWISEKLSQETEATLAYAKQKLFVREEINNIRLIFGGGGHTDYPYKDAVMKPFNGQLFRNNINPDMIGLPLPRDLYLEESSKRWMKRLTVAYGLSFEKGELAKFTYPSDVNIPTSEQIWSNRKYIPDAPSKDVC